MRMVTMRLSQSAEAQLGLPLALPPRAPPTLVAASLIGWTSSTLSMTELDMNPPGGPAGKPPVYESAKRTLEVFEAEVVKARAALAAASDADFAMSRVAVIRIFVMNHIIHHRAQLTVSLRMKDIPVPSIYGPSDDEGNM